MLKLHELSQNKTIQCFWTYFPARWIPPGTAKREFKSSEFLFSTSSTSSTKSSSISYWRFSSDKQIKTPYLFSLNMNNENLE